ncbi:Uncharacterised protein [Mycobacteroides abscessus subsp. abscessus]|nr:Uncharacterised protein [Mycobacteroides abscessus subsp. abscessus]
MSAYRSPLSASSVTTEPPRPVAAISEISRNAPHRLVPVDAPTRRPSTALACRVSATE